jgi:putative ABC transport system substrate-binding protein
MRLRITGFAVLFALCLLTTPPASEAQQAGKVYRVGLIFTTSPVAEMAGPEPVHPNARVFVHAMRALGYLEGQNLILERRSAEGRFERFPDIVAELVRLKADVIVTPNDSIVRAAMTVTKTVPIVMVSGDPVREGFVQSLARPGGNITGLAAVVGPEIEAKRLQLLREALPGVSRVAYLGSKLDKEWEGPYGQSVRAAAQVLGVTLLPAEYTPRQFTDAFTLVSGARAGALFVGPGGAPAFANRGLIVDFATRARLPSTFGYREPVELGGLMSYGVNYADVFRRAAGYVDKILKGAKPPDLPVEQPTKFELVINLKTAKALGLTIPQSLLGRADEVIQ